MKSHTIHEENELMEEGEYSSVLASPAGIPNASPERYMTDSLYHGNLHHPITHVLDKNSTKTGKAPKLGTFPVYMTSCETMWGVILFVKFDELLGLAGLYDIFLALGLVMTCQLLAASSLSAIATNGRFQSGGSYYMVVRSLGPAIGAAIGVLYYIGMGLLAVVEVQGATEALHAAFQLATTKGAMISFYWDQVIFGTIMMVTLTAIRLKDGHLVHMIGLLVMVVVVLTATACMTGIFMTSNGWGSEIMVPNPSLSWDNFNANLDSKYTPERTFGKTVLALMYPTFIGIFQGANKASELKNPYRSIPRGAFGSVLTSGVFYTIICRLLAAVATPEHLRDPNVHVLIYLAWPSKWVSVIGTIIVGLGSALSCIDVAPRILQSMAKDGYIPQLAPLAKLHGKSKEPRLATLVTLILCLPAIFIEDIETVATYTSLAFLCMYASMNASCFVLSTLKLHSWRPRFKYYHWSSALMGFILCLVIMFWMEPIAAGIILVLFFSLIVYVQIRGETVIWGHGAEGLKYKLALSSLMALEKHQFAEENDDSNISEHDLPANVDMELAEDAKGKEWRPQLLCYVKLDEPEGTPSPYILDFVQQLKGSKGLNLIATILRDDPTDGPSHCNYYQHMATRVQVATQRLTALMDASKIQGFRQVITAPTYEIGENTMIQTLGLGTLRPNTLVVRWPKHRATEEETEERAARFLRFLGCATAFEKAVVALKPGTSSFPKINERMQGTIDVWWVVHDGGLLLLLSHLLRQHATWKDCRLRIFTAVDGSEQPHVVQKALAQYLADLRIEAEVHVVEISTREVAEFCTEWTLRSERYKKIIKSPTTCANARGVLLQRSHSTTSPKASGIRTGRSLSAVFSSHSSSQVSSSQSSVDRSCSMGHTQFRAAKTLTSAMLDHSSKAQLVVLNLPVPSEHNWKVATSYLDMIEDMTDKLQRVLLVHGSGNEALSRFA